MQFKLHLFQFGLNNMQSD